MSAIAHIATIVLCLVLAAEVGFFFCAVFHAVRDFVRGF